MPDSALPAHPSVILVPLPWCYLTVQCAIHEVQEDVLGGSCSQLGSPSRALLPLRISELFPQSSMREMGSYLVLCLLYSAPSI